MKVVKTVFIVLLVATISTTVQAQKVGIRAGLNIANISGNDFGNTKSLLGFYLGVFKEITLVPEVVFLQPELQYSSQGFKIESTNYSIGYIHIPVLAKFYVAKKFSLEAGPQIGFKINDNFKGDTGDDLKSFETSIAAGFGYNFPLGISLNARYALGLTNIAKDSDAKNQVFQLGAAFKF